MSISVDMGMRLISMLFSAFGLVTSSLAQEAAADVQQVQMLDARERPQRDARGLAAIASRDKVAIVVWGGNRAIQQEAYFAARDLAGAGIPVAFLVGPDHNSLDGDAVMQVYAASAPRSDAHWGLNNADRVRSDMRAAGLTAYPEAFPAQWAPLQARRR